MYLEQINFSQKHDFNPPHTHTGILSFVIFCKVPEEIFEVQADSNTQRAGELHFTYGEQITKLMGCEYPVKPSDLLGEGKITQLSLLSGKSNN